MSKVKFTDKYIRSLKPTEGGRLEVSDEVVPGLRMRVTPKGKKSWMFEKRVKGGPKRKHDLGRYPDISIRQARQLANEIQVEANAGIDRVALRRERHEAEELERRSAITLNKTLELYYEFHAVNLRSGVERMHQLRNALEPYLEAPSKKINNHILQAAIDEKAASGTRVTANRLRAYFSHFAKFGRARGHFEPNVGKDLEKVKTPPPRVRTPSIEEVRDIFNATFAIGDFWGPLFRLILLTGQRKSEIAKLRWSEVDFDRSCLILGGVRTKNTHAHVTHLSPPALAELQWLHASADEDADLIFTTTGTTPASGFSKAKARLDRAIGDKVKPWRLHDLRASFATTMAERGHPESVVDRVLNHVASGSAPSVVARIYNRAQLLKPRQLVLDDWARIVTEMPEGASAENIVRIG